MRCLLLGLTLLTSCHEVAEVLRAGAGGEGTAGSGGVGGGATGGGGNGNRSTGGGGSAGTAGGVTPDPSLKDSLSAGQAHTCLARAGLLYCWGDNAAGELGTGDKLPRLAPTRVDGAEGVVAVATGGEHTCVLTRAGSVACFGSNALGQLGTSGLAEALGPTTVQLPDRAVALDVGYGHSCAILARGELHCWGENVETQLGQGDSPDENHPEPVQVPLPEAPQAVVCGQGHTLALTSTGVYAWGRNSESECGLGEGQPVRVRTPTFVPGTGGLVGMDTGQSSSCAWTSAGALWCWGPGTDQLLGNARDATLWSPELVTSDFAWAQVSLDTFHTCALDGKQALYCWGRSIEGQLGLGNNDPVTPAPTRVTGGAWRTVSVGRFHTCAISEDDRVWCTGANQQGQLGVGDTDRRDVLSEVALPEP